jgi:SOS-response transcriptional repressor LexA
MSTYSERLVKAMALKPWSQTELALAVGVKPQAIQYLCKSGKGSTHTGKIAKLCGVNSDWLSDGEGEMLLVNESHNEYIAHTDTPNIIAGPELKGEVPLISWVQAGDWCEAIDLFSPGDAERWLPCPVNHSDKTFILRVQGSSMEPEYRDGDLIFVDPLVEASHNSDIIVRLENSNTATFKRLQIVDGKQYLSPINRDWPEQVIQVTEHANICGVVIFSGRLR